MAFFRFAKSIFLDFYFSFGVSYWIYCLFYDRPLIALKYIKKGIIVSFIIIFIYSFFELFYFYNIRWAKEVLRIVTPYIHAIKEGRGWWPPLFWPMQLRSVFPEPSFYGLFGAYALPFLWTKVLRNEKNKILLLSNYAIVFTLLMTIARTAIFILIGELILFFIIFLYKERRNVMKKFCPMFISVVLAMFSQNIFYNYSIESMRNTSIRTDKVITFKQQNVLVQSNGDTHVVSDENSVNHVPSNSVFEAIHSMGSTKMRSNGGRFGILYADIMIWKENKILGVGTGLLSAYIPSKLPAFAFENIEIKIWLEQQKEEGILKNGMPNLDNVFSVLAEKGIVGWIFYFSPFFYVCFHLLKGLKADNSTHIDLLAGFFVAIIGTVVTGLAGAYSILGTAWILLGIGYIITDNISRGKFSEN